MRSTTQTKTTILSALALAGTLALGACSTADDQDAGAASTDGTTSTQDAGAATAAPDQAATTLDIDAVPDPVAEVNGEAISKDDFVAAFESQRASAQQQAQMTGAPVDETALQDQVVDMLVDGELLQQEGERLQLEISEEEIDAELADLVEQSGTGSTEELMTLLEEQGVGEEQVREELGRLVLIDKLVEENGGVEEPSEQELKDYYEELTGQSADGEDAASTGAPDDAAASADAGAAQMPSYAEVEDQLAEQLRQEKENELLTGMLDELRQDADVTSHV